MHAVDRRHTEIKKTNVYQFTIENGLRFDEMIVSNVEN